MPRARQETRGRITVGDRSIQAPTDIQPILRREGVDTSGLQNRINNLQQRVSSLENQLSDARSQANQAESRVQSLQSQLADRFTEGQVRQVAQQAFNQGVQAVVQYLRNQGVI